MSFFFLTYPLYNPSVLIYVSFSFQCLNSRLSYLSNVMLLALGHRFTCDGIVDALRFPYTPWAGILRKVPYSQILSHEAVKLKSCFVLGMLCLYNTVSFFLSSSSVSSIRFIP